MATSTMQKNALGVFTRPVWPGLAAPNCCGSPEPWGTTQHGIGNQGQPSVHYKSRRLGATSDRLGHGGVPPNVCVECVYSCSLASRAHYQLQAGGHATIQIKCTVVAATLSNRLGACTMSSETACRECTVRGSRIAVHCCSIIYYVISDMIL